MLENFDLQTRAPWWHGIYAFCNKLLSWKIKKLHFPKGVFILSVHVLCQYSFDF